MSYLLLPLEKLDLDPNNLRRTYPGIEELAETIANHGLLQNLVVEPNEGSDIFTVRAGNRRLLALRLLKKQGRWSEPVPCLLKTGSLTQIVENIQREDVTPWALGYRYMEIIEEGVNGRDLAKALGKSYGHVSLHVLFANGIHPEVQKRLDELGHRTFTKKHLSDLARLVDEGGEADKNRQHAYVDKTLKLAEADAIAKNIARGTPNKSASKDAQLKARFEKLRRGEVPMEHGMEPYVQAVVDYLTGLTISIKRTKAKFI